MIFGLRATLYVRDVKVCLRFDDEVKIFIDLLQFSRPEATTSLTGTVRLLSWISLKLNILTRLYSSTIISNTMIPLAEHRLSRIRNILYGLKLVLR